MVTSLSRELDGNVVLRSDTFALRFFHEWGGCPLQWWSEPYPLLTNDFPGSGASVAFDTGQDPTQASANGLLPNPIARLGDNTSQKYNYYMRETLFDNIGNYIITGFAPDFWLSSEPVDDAICPQGFINDHGWRTKYIPVGMEAILNTASCPVIFQGSNFNPSGIFCVGNEIKPTGLWSNRLREYKNGRIAFKIVLSLQDANSNSIAGFMFRKSIPEGSLNKDNAYLALGYALYFNKKGGWELLRRDGNETKLASGKLSTTEINLLNGYGLEIEVRTHNYYPKDIEIHINGTLAKIITDPKPLLGPHFCLFASSATGIIVFRDRRIWDVGLMMEVQYKALPNKTLMSRVTIKNTTGLDESYDFYRANTPAIFFNKTTFPIGQRTCWTVKYDGTQTTDEGVFLLKDYKSFWCGNYEGTIGLLATPLTVTVDKKLSDSAHVLLQKRAFNDEFVMMFNPLGMNQVTTCKEMFMEIMWNTILQ